MHDATLPTPGSGALSDDSRSWWLTRLIIGNIFYFLSAAFMLLGCYMLIHSGAGKGLDFPRTLKSLLMLQTYELLVILTALIIVRHFRRLDDAFHLLLIEWLLVFDPTFFSNSFHTMPGDVGPLVNIVCLMLAPLKLALLQRGLRLRLHPRAWAGLLAAAAFVYLSEYPLSHPRRNSHDPASFMIFYGMCWVPAVVSALLPAVRCMLVDTTHLPKQFISDRRQAFLRWALLLLPMLVIFAHLAETLRVHEIPYYMAFVTPLLLGMVLLITNNSGERILRLLPLVDGLLALALIFSLRPLNLIDFGDKLSNTSAAIPTPLFVLTNRPLLCAALGVAGVYGYLFWRTRSRAVIWRLAGMLALGGRLRLVSQHVGPGRPGLDLVAHSGGRRRRLALGAGHQWQHLVRCHLVL